MANKRFFHISDILSVATEYILGSQRDLVSPNGEKRNKDGMDCYMEICSFSSGITLRIKKDGHYIYDDRKHFSIRDAVKNSILYRYDWLKEIEFPIDEVPSREDGATQEDLDQYIEDFVASIRQCYDVDEWLEVEQLSPREITMFKKNIRALSPTIH